MSDKPKILHYGLHRTGTNFLEAILSDNFDVEIINASLTFGDVSHVCHKHARLYDDNNSASGRFKGNCHNIKDFEDLNLRIKKHNLSPDFFVVISKDPYSWLLSHRHHASEYSEYTNLTNHPIKEYNSYYKKLISLSKNGGNFIFVKYIDLISNVDTLIRLGELMNLEKRVENIKNNKKRVYMSTPFSEDRKQFYMDKLYLNKLHHDSQDSIEEINQNLDKEVVEYLGYDIEEPKVI